jgi:signal transduction histidine kinase
MGVGVDRLIFRRVHRLQLALDHAASRVTAADIVPISVAGQDEFGAITRSINTIMTRLGEEIEAGRESEEEARASLTSLQNAQAGLVQAEKMASLGSLVAGISHELNTPIGNILLVASMQEDNAIELEKAVVADGLTRSAFISFLEKSKEGAQLLVNSARRAAQLIQNFKQVAVDQTTDQLRDFDLAQQIDEVLSVISHILSKTSIKLEKRLSPDIAMHSYPGPLGQVLTNTVMNAIKHAFDEVTPGTITVTCESRGERACITVADNGKGIAPENIGKIFDPFFTTRMGQGGSGLGLHISHNIVHGPLGGILSVASRRGEGTTFTILIPFKAPV